MTSCCKQLWPMGQVGLLMLLILHSGSVFKSRALRFESQPAHQTSIASAHRPTATSKPHWDFERHYIYISIGNPRRCSRPASSREPWSFRRVLLDGAGGRG